MEKSKNKQLGMKIFLVLVGLGVMAFSVYHYYDLLDWEQNGGRVLVMNRFARVLYDLGGPIAVSVGIALAGVGCIYYALVKLGKSDNSSQPNS